MAAPMDFAYDWEPEADRLSFEDSDRFEEDSLCSWASEPESLCNNWRGWRKTGANGYYNGKSEERIAPLVELASKAVACNLPFEVVEHFYPPVPEQLQLRIAHWSFPENEEDIRLYSCLANGSADEFVRGEHLYKAKAVKDVLQIGFHLSGTVVPPPAMSMPQSQKGTMSVAVVFDRRRITACSCTCRNENACSWCAHVVAICLYRIHQANSICLRAPVSESLSRLHRDQLQKFAQYLITELPQQILPTAQRLLDELLSSQQSAINTVYGAPDPTAGPSASEQTKWCLDERNLHENIKKTLVKFCVPTPMVFSDVNYLVSNAPPAASEWQSLLRPLRGREPEGMWNLLSIIREMYRRHDSNATPFIEILTDEVLCCEQLMVWWFTTKVSAAHNSSNHSARSAGGSTSNASQNASSSLCDEIVAMWRLAALNPALSPIQRDDLMQRLKDWHASTIDKVRKARGANMPGSVNSVKRSDIELFPGFKSAIEACQLDWTEYPIPGITYVEKSHYVERLRLNASKGQETECRKTHIRSQVNGLVQDNSYYMPFKKQEEDGACSSSSEGFCESFRDFKTENRRDSDSSFTEDLVAQDVTPKKKEDSDDSPLEGAAAAPPPPPPAKDDEYQVYFYDTKAKLGGDSLTSDKKKKPDEPNYFAGLRKLENKQEILFARAEALHAHGHNKVACKLAKELAEEILANPPDATVEQQPTTGKGKKKKALNNTTQYSSTTLAKAAFLCNVLLDDTECHNLAFRVGMFGLEMPRPPAFSKALEVRLNNQEGELAALLKKIPLGPAELNYIRDRAEQLRDGRLRSRGEALLPLALAGVIFDCLCSPACPVNGSFSKPCSRSSMIHRLPTDEKLGFEAAVIALSLKANIAEAEHPLLCEGTRRQRGDLALAMLLHYKDDQNKLSKIMDKLLDKDVHQLYKAPPLRTYLTSSQTSSTNSSASSTLSSDTSTSASTVHAHSTSTAVVAGAGAGVVLNGVAGQAVVHRGAQPGPSTSNGACVAVPPEAPRSWPGSGGQSQSLEYLNLEHKFSTLNVTQGAKPKSKLYNSLRSNSKDTDSSALEEDGEGSSDYKAWEAKFRCTNLKTIKKPSVGMAAIDSSAPETTSSDNSPTMVRRNWGSSGKHQGPASDSGSSGKSSDSIGSSSSGDKAAANKARDNESPLTFTMRYTQTTSISQNTPAITTKGSRHKNKNRMPTIPNQPSEALAHFMLELAKTVLAKAGGSSSTQLFTHTPNNQSHVHGPHRNLHICAFQIGLYALGVSNCVTPNWLSRTYSSHVSWITGQAMEIGSAAVNILIDTWEGHLTPVEVAYLADRVSNGTDRNPKKAAAALALSCLPHAHALNPNEITRAFSMCKEQSDDMLEKACLAVESAAKDGGVYPEVLFEVARNWYARYEKATANSQQSNSPDNHRANSPLEAVVARQGQQRTSPTMPVVSLQQQIQQRQIPTVTIPYTIAPQPAPQLIQYPAPAGYNYVQQIPVSPYQAAVPIPQHYLAAPIPYSTAQHFNNISIQHPGTATIYHPVAGQVAAAAQASMPVYTTLAPARGMVPQMATMPIVGMDQAQAQMVAEANQEFHLHQSNGGTQVSPVSHNSPHMNYLLAAYRVGMLAIETLARRIHNDRPQANYARNPPHGEDIKWLLGISKKLGPNYLSQFCANSINAIVSPFLLQEISVDAAQYLARNNPNNMATQLRSPVLSPMVQKCLHMYSVCSQHQISHISQTDYDEFINIIRSARTAFCMAPGGMQQFTDLLQTIRRSKFCKKDLWQRIVNCLNVPGSI